MSVVQTIKNQLIPSAPEAPTQVPTPSAWTAPIDRLPEKSRLKFFRVSEEAELAHTVFLSLFERLTEARDTLAAQEARRRHLQSFVRVDEASIKDIREKIERSKREVARLSAEIEMRQEKARPILELRDALQSYIEKRLPNGPCELAPDVAPTLKKGETIAGAIEKIRGEIADLKNERFEVENASLPASIAKQMMRAEIDRIAASGKPNVFDLVEGRERISWPLRRAAGSDAQIDAFAFTMWLNRDSVVARLETAIDTVSDPAGALTDDERAKKLRAIAAQIYNLELAEEHIIDAACAAGATVARRGDADPRAVLGLAETAPAPRRD